MLKYYLKVASNIGYFYIAEYDNKNGGECKSLNKFKFWIKMNEMNEINLIYYIILNFIIINKYK